MALSFSALDTFSKCERQWWYKYVERLDEGPAPQLVIGIVYHEALAYLAANKARPAPEQLVAWFDRERERPYWSHTIQVQAVCQEILKNLERVATEILPHLKVEEIEQWLPRGGDYTGKIDVLLSETPIVDCGTIVGSEDGGCILDWKTVESAAKANRNREYKDHAFQLGMYALPKGCRAGAIVEVPRDGVSAINVSVYKFDDQFCARLRAYLREQIEAIKGRTEKEQCKLAAWGHPLCSQKYCAYWKMCAGGGAC